MKIEKHLLHGVNFIRSPNTNKTFIPVNLKYLVMHFTGPYTLQSVINTFTNPKSMVSAHLVIDRDGKITQLVPFNYVAWHAGNSSWHGIRWMNNYSIGIEFVNDGKLKKKNGLYLNDVDMIVDEQNVFIDGKEYWEKFTDIQIEKGLEVSKLLINEYKLKEVLGHSDIAPGRKIDPGKAFPMGKFKELVE